MSDILLFVNTSHGDKPSKKLIRSHVMRGKNVGKQINRRSRLELHAAECQPARYGCRIAPIRGVEGSFLACSLPVFVSLASQRIINECKHGICVGNIDTSLTKECSVFDGTCERIYPAQLGISVLEAKLHWLPTLFTDEASESEYFEMNDSSNSSYTQAYLCNIALMQACNEIYSSDGFTTPAACLHLAQTFSQVQRRLEGNYALSDSTIAVVVSLIMQEQIRNQCSAAAVHFKGLEQLIQLRGGLAELEGNTPLVLKICKTDIVFALQHGGSTIFCRDRLPEIKETLYGKATIIGSNTFAAGIAPGSLDSNLDEILQDILWMCSVFNHKAPGFKMDLETYEEVVISLGYRLAQYRALIDPRQRYGVLAAYHLGLTVFMMTTFLKCDRRRIIECRSIPLHLRDTLDSPFNSLDNRLMLWILLIGGIWMSEDTDMEWFVSKVKPIAQQLQVYSWEEVRKAVMDFPWINLLHDKPGRKLWDLARSRSLTLD